MPKLETFNAQPNVQSNVPVRRASVEDIGSGDAGAGGAKIAAALSQVSVDMKAREEREDVSNINILNSTAAAELTAKTSALEKGAALGAKGHVENIQKVVDDFYDTTDVTATTNAGRVRLQEQKARMKAVFTRLAIEFQGVSRGKKAKADFTTGLQQDEFTLLQKPEMLDELLSAKQRTVSDPDGTLFHLTNAASRQELSEKAQNDLTKFAVRGWIRKDPNAAKERIEGGEFNKTMNPDDAKLLISEANQAISATKAGIAAQKKRAEEAKKVQLENEQEQFFNMLHTGVDENGQPVNSTTLTRMILDSNTLPAFGKGSKDVFIKQIELRAQGETTADLDAAEKLQSADFLSIARTGRDLMGVEVTREELEKRLIATAYLSLGSKSTILRVLDARTAGAGAKAEDDTLNMVLTGVDAKGEKLSDSQMKELIRKNPDLSATDGAGSKKAFIKMVDDMATATQNAAEKLESADFLSIARTGRDLKGVEVTREELEKRLIATTHLSLASKSAILRVLDARTAGGGVRDKAEDDTLSMVLTGVDATGVQLTDFQMKERIRKNPDLSATDGAGSKKAFIKMVDDMANTRRKELQSTYKDKIYDRIHLPDTHPNHLSVEDLLSDVNITRRSGGFGEAEKLLQTARRLVNTETKATEKAKKAFTDMFKTTITKTSLVKSDGKGDELFGLFIQEIDRKIAEAEKKNEDPLALFDASDKKNYLGPIVAKYVRSIEERAANTRDAVSGRFSPTPVTPSGPKTGVPPIQEGERPEDYLKRLAK